MKKVISFSIWGNGNNYLRGAIKNMEKAKVFYPDWVVRFYYQEDMNKTLLRTLAKNGCEMFPMPFFRDPWFGLYWRFRPMFDDPGIERFIVRDTDARLSAREADAVREWIESGKPFHVMRDNPAHNIQILGGMWGAVAGLIPDFEARMDRWMKCVEGNKQNPRTRFHGTDQDFLCRKIWPLVEKCHVAHICDCSGLKFTGKEKIFRVTNPGDYRVGT